MKVFRTVLLLHLVACLTPSLPWGDLAGADEPSPSVGLSPSSPAQPFKDCLGKGRESAPCLDRLFRLFLENDLPAAALQLVHRLQAADVDIRLMCHPIVHALGRELFRLKGTIHDSFAVCDQTCHSGCYHGVVERFLWGAEPSSAHVNQEALKVRAPSACDPELPLRLRFQCLHGLGHALLYFSGYGLEKALEACDTLAEAWSRQSCYGGVFMENVSPATSGRGDVSATDFHHPCTRLDPKYRGDCYLMQTSRMSEMGLSTDGLVEQCSRAGAYRQSCFQSMGRDLSNNARVKAPESAAQGCALAAGSDRDACVRGVLYALIDHTWDGSYALPFCAALRGPGDKEYCFAESGSYLSATFALSRTDLADQCRKHLSKPEGCLGSMAR